MKDTARISLTPLVDVALDDFRIASPRRIGELLNGLLIGREPVALHAAGTVQPAGLVAIDKSGGRLKFRLAATDNNRHTVLDSDETLAVALLDNIKLQFALRDPTQVRNGQHTLVDFNLPCEVFRFQRRDAYRVRPLWCDSPRATVRLGTAMDEPLQFRIVDVSLGGCALLVLEEIPSLNENSLPLHAVIDLDEDTSFSVDLRIRNVTQIDGNKTGSRLGCEFVNALGDVQRLLQRYLFETEKRRVTPA